MRSSWSCCPRPPFSLIRASFLAAKTINRGKVNVVRGKLPGLFGKICVDKGAKKKKKKNFLGYESLLDKIRLEERPERNHSLPFLVLAYLPAIPKLFFFKLVASLHG